ncbi:MAG: hypothetical protein NC413_01795 [Muribaculum sp.]|nr:hypothetical protein [Muribaculum sp.]
MLFSDEYFTGLVKTTLEYCQRNYDYCYLSAMHEKNKAEGAKTIIVGSSHAMNGIIENVFDDRPINFSISSQDIFYDFQNIQKAVNEGAKRIENCIINLGYYMLYQDVSLSKNIGQVMIPRVYAPLFGELHNYSGAADYDGFQNLHYDRAKYSEELVKLICTEWIRKGMLKEASYYDSQRTRENNNTLFRKGTIWQKLSESEREALAIERTNDHNRIKQHIASRQENADILREMVTFLAEHDIRTLFVIFPFTNAYNKYIDPEYKTDIMGALDALEQPVEFIDMNESDCFDDTDFLDTDHLNAGGADKASRLLNSIL